jgi:altered-inheritance-of-mitochondria protein 13
LKDISSALEKENLDKEKPGMSSEVLGRDIEEIREKIERMKKDRMGQVGKGVQSAQEGVKKCYTYVMRRRGEESKTDDLVKRAIDH